MVTINIGRNAMIFFGVILLVFAVAGLTIAFGGTQPNVMGHSAGELDGVCKTDGSGCPPGLGGGQTWSSGWFSCTSQGTYVLNHNLGSSNILTDVFFAPDSGGSPDLSKVMDNEGLWYQERGLVVQDITDTQLTLQASLSWIHTRLGTSGRYNTDGGAEYNTGWCKVLASTSAGSSGPASLGGGEVRFWQNMGPHHTQDSQTHSTTCNSGYIMSGMRAWASSYVEGYMTSQCTETSLTLSGSTTKGPLGNLDNQFQTLNCDNGQAIRSISIYCAAYWDTTLQLDCGTVTGASLDDANPVWALNLYGGVNNDQYSSITGGVYDSETITASCPQGYVATGVKMWAGPYIENFDIKCKKII